MKTNLRTYFLVALVQVLEGWRHLLELHNGTMLLLFLPHMERLRWNLGKLKALAVFEEARRRTPAYRQFLAEHPFGRMRFRSLVVPDLGRVPVMDKENYVKRFDIGARCRGGRVPSHGVIVDESSGSSGVPTNWVRGHAERQANKRMLEFGLTRLIGEGPHFILNAFAMGPWATGINITMGLTDISMLKSTGPDVPKIANTLRFFGPGHRYLVLGYPPFLKLLVDTAGIDWAAYDVSMIYGGEGISELMRDYLLAKGIRRVYGSLGASDLELNIAAENDFTIGLRKALLASPALRAKLLHFPGAVPVVFQFNPADFHLETTRAGELLVTLCRPNYLSPKIRYNLHDRAQIIRFPELKRLLRSCGLRPEDFALSYSDLPILLHYGRADMTVAYFGCKVSPPDVQEALLGVPELAERVASFTLFTSEGPQADKQLRICFELAERQPLRIRNDAALNDLFFEELRRINQDFRESWRMVPEGQKPQVEFFAYKTGPFADEDIRIKRRYIQAA
ncbi:hypothetical protein Q5H92_23080 [Hymenobacter sp. M29]|uniref:CoF synthetase n=1 Tax=Hymenobacter mellowenesis TaxID=3063995 RepID=A0ABT9AHB6_9BACT|nr:hypothetical protein [Hymenobacter sp. M29]MDO7849266.1 hypothetical protein [Hymenobacter sp. M29]